MDPIIARLVAQVTNMQRQIDELTARLDGMNLRTTKPKLPFSSRFPDCSAIVRLKAQLFENQPRQGVSRYLVKVAVWDRPEAREEAEQQHWPNGYYNNWCFPLQTRDAFVDGHGEKWRRIDPDHWLGCVAHKGVRKSKGTSLERDHVACFEPEARHLALLIRDTPFQFVKGTPIATNNPKSPIHIWYLDL